MDDIISQMASAEKLKSLAAAARDLYQRGDWTAAKEASAKLAAASRIVGNRLRLQEALMVEGLLLYREGQWDGALERFKEQESICRDLLLRPLLVGSLGHQALVLSRCDDPEKAESALRLFEEAEQICRQDREPKTLMRILLDKGRLLFEMSPDHSRERSVFREAGDIARTLGAEAELAAALFHEAECLGWNEVEEIRGLCRNALAAATAAGSSEFVPRIEEMLALLSEFPG